MRFVKMQGVGNDFLLFDGRECTNVDWPKITRQVCTRRFGVGGDGIMVIEKSEIADAFVQMYNPDGTADMCGNGMRCAAAYMRALGLATSDELTMATMDGVKRAQIDAYLEQGALVSIDMGRPELRAERIPTRGTGDRVLEHKLDIGGRPLVVSSVKVGTPHAVIFTDALPADAEFYELSPLIELHEFWPERTNVMWAAVEDTNRVKVRIWERGAHETSGCGTGACAVAAVGRLLGLTCNRTTVVSAGGELTVQLSDDNEITMTGPVGFVFEGEWPMHVRW